MAERPGTVLAEIPLGPRDVLRVTREHDRGQARVNLRRWFASASGELRPGRDGIAFDLDEVPAVLEALERAASEPAGSGVLQSVIAVHGAATARNEAS